MRRNTFHIHPEVQGAILQNRHLAVRSQCKNPKFDNVFSIKFGFDSMDFAPHIPESLQMEAILYEKHDFYVNSLVYF